MMALDHLSALLEADPLLTRSWGGCRARPRPTPRETPLVTETAEGSSGAAPGAPSDAGTLALCSPTAHLLKLSDPGPRAPCLPACQSAPSLGFWKASRSGLCAASLEWAQSSPQGAVRLRRGRGRADRQGCSGLVFTRSLAFAFCSVVAVTPGVGS